MAHLKKQKERKKIKKWTENLMRKQMRGRQGEEGGREKWEEGRGKREEWGGKWEGGKWREWRGKSEEGRGKWEEWSRKRETRGMKGEVRERDRFNLEWKLNHKLTKWKKDEIEKWEGREKLWMIKKKKEKLEWSKVATMIDLLHPYSCLLLSTAGWEYKLFRKSYNKCRWNNVMRRSHCYWYQDCHSRIIVKVDCRSHDFEG